MFDFQLIPDCSNRSKLINWFMVESESLEELLKHNRSCCGEYSQ